MALTVDSSIIILVLSDIHINIYILSSVPRLVLEMALTVNSPMIVMVLSDIHIL